LPTLQSNLNYAVNEILRRMNCVGIGEVWRSIETLHMILPPPIFKEVASEYERITKRLSKANNGNSVDFLQMVESNAACVEILEWDAFPFFRMMYDKLYEGGYLEKTLVQARYPNRRKLSADGIGT